MGEGGEERARVVSFFFFFFGWLVDPFYFPNFLRQSGTITALCAGIGLCPARPPCDE